MLKKGLKKELTLFNAVLYGVGVILGAGIYVLIGQGAAIAGNALWISFLIASFIAAFTGFSYAELAGMFPRNAAEYVYTKNAFGSRILAFVVQWVMLITLIISAATVALGFGGYFNYMFSAEPAAAAALLVVGLSLINYVGIKESTKYNTISTTIEVSGLLVVAILGLFFISRTKADFFYSPSGFEGIISAASLIFFAYIGFEEVVNLSEDTKKANKIIPKALIISLAISTLFYMAVSLSSLSVLGAERLGASKAPLTEVISSVFPKAGIIMSMIALFATSNTVLVIMLVASRMLYGLSHNNLLPKFLGVVNKKGTPHLAIVTVMALVIASISIGNIKTVALLTDVGIFFVYIFINSSVIFLRYKKPFLKRSFKSPFSIGKLPLLAFFGLFSSAFMLSHFSKDLLLAEAAIVTVGFVVGIIFAKRDVTNKIRLFSKSRWRVMKKIGA
ncbi:MAG: amino acid permease [Candidatus Aenigmarchaeota archaeon]|nr:amino acid permease [Candidatus Aenigmarchaeota archaeon]